jgi:hypothetical protein
VIIYFCYRTKTPMQFYHEFNRVVDRALKRWNLTSNANRASFTNLPPAVSMLTPSS